MYLPPNLLAALSATQQSDTALSLVWPVVRKSSEITTFATIEEWHAALSALDLDEAVPLVVRAKYERAQRLFLLGWIDMDLVKAGELVSFTALELAVADRYGRLAQTDRERQKNKKPNLSVLLKYMVSEDGLTDEKLPLIQRYGGTVIGLLTGERVPTLSDIRNGLAHGDPIDGFPWGGLLHLVHDLIEYAYREVIRGCPPNLSTP